MTKLMSKSELIQKVADQHSLAKKDVKNVIESLASVGYKELKKTGAFLLPGFAKFVVIKKSATKERAGNSYCIAINREPPLAFRRNSNLR